MSDLETYDAKAVERLFTRSDGQYVFARWGRAIAPVVFGVNEATLEVFKGACEAVVTLAGHKMTDVDPELGTNLMVFFCKDWGELTEVPHLDRLVPDLVPLVARLKGADANQYRIFRFDEAGGIKACFVFLRLDEVLADTPAETIALSQMAQMIVLWSDEAFLGSSPLAVVPDGGVILKPQVGDVIRAAYDPVLPVVANDASHALRIFARMGQRHDA
ncbi:hypothetical protein [Nereida sp. MMG025]|uniref:hypothetical protein n=1 Tax=Nereida sp. MMG025 TaxID=2909981 RepID=UPI001F2F79A7|nr:hypothetical protein [Nereida sp. MMG025]MCF6444976.1 hypothetical protein [Nereida sp. MMG025]